MINSKDCLWNNTLKFDFDIDPQIIDLSKTAETDIKAYIRSVTDIASFNQLKVLTAMRNARLSDFHFTNSTGYGYGDSGKAVIEDIYTQIFKCESALVRSQIISGTHAITLCLFGVLRPGDQLLSITGTPYDTLKPVLTGQNCGSLADLGVKYSQVDLLENGGPDYDGVYKRIKNDPPKMVLIQRSRGYSLRPTLNIDQIEKLINIVKSIDEQIVCFVDNCYGEFVETREPTEVGADLCAGSLIKNLGGGIVPAGGYVVGREDLVDQCYYRLTVPGLDTDSGPSLMTHRLSAQGLFLAPLVVAESLKGSIYTSRILELAGIEVSPKYHENRSDIVTAAILEKPERLIAFCEGIQAASPVDANVAPIPSEMPGYDSKVIMAAGCFIQGASIELTADGPLKPPYVVYIQGGLSYAHVKIGIMKALQRLRDI